jgi:hypothetical protein
LVDLSSDHKYLGGSSDGVEYHGMMHFSDWLPTLSSLAGISSEKFPDNLDGFDFSSFLRSLSHNISSSASSAEIDVCTSATGCESPRNEMLLEMYYPSEFVFNESLEAYRYGDYKLIKGIPRDINYYFESSGNYLNYSSPTFATRVIEYMLQLGDWYFGNNRFDGTKIYYTHIMMQNLMTKSIKQADDSEMTRLYNIRKDPTESNNLWNESWAKPIIAKIENRLEFYRSTRQPSQKAHYFLHLRDTWPKTFVQGDCSMNPSIPADQCHFTHPWLRDVSTSCYFVFHSDICFSIAVLFRMKMDGISLS